MKIDIAEIHKFYHSRLGKLAQKYIARKIAYLWPDAVNDIIVGYGYPLPYLERYHPRAEQIAVLMPCFQGASPWPEDKANAVALTQADRLPLRDNSVNRLLIIHALEHSEDPVQLLREAWRVLIDGGCVLIVVPNRRGFWARNPLTPFGVGEPYSGHQLYALIEESLFTPSKPLYALFTPPTQLKVILSAAETLERLGSSGWMNKIGGITLIEAHKQVISPVFERPKPWRSRIFIPNPSPKKFLQGLTKMMGCETFSTLSNSFSLTKDERR